jgi:hypothetical protein
MSIEPVSFDSINKQSSNIYEITASLSLRAKQINEELRSELEEKLSPFQLKIKNPSEGEADKVFPEQVAITVQYEQMPKPTRLALDELQNDEYTFKYQESTVRRRP